jgi:GNAT superfamily N-acetyltransferase
MRSSSGYVELVGRVAPEAALAVPELRAIERELELVHLLAELDGEGVGAGFCVKKPRMRARRAAHAKARVPEEHRCRGVGSALYAVLSEWALERDVELFETDVTEDDEASLGWAQRRGFEETGREQRVELDVTRVKPPSIDPPPGVEIVSWADRPNLTGGLYEVAIETYRDIPGSEEDEMESFAEWLAHDMRGPGDRPEATFVAVAGEEVVGYAKFSLTNARPAVAYHDLTGVKRAWRRRGIAGALKRAEIAWAKSAGYERLSTTNELRNEPIRRLNERLGYQPVPGRIFLRGPLASRSRTPSSPVATNSGAPTSSP